METDPETPARRVADGVRRWAYFAGGGRKVGCGYREPPTEFCQAQIGGFDFGAFFWGVEAYWSL